MAKAIDILPKSYRKSAKHDLSAMKRWYGAAQGEHSFHQRPPPWLALTETQVMAGLCHFTNSLGQEAGRAMLDALSPGLCPEGPALISCVVEEPTANKKRSRIDLILRAEAGPDRQLYCVVVEAKLGSTLEKNPLAEYRRHALDFWLEDGESFRLKTKAAGKVKTEARELRDDNLDLIVLDYGYHSKTASRLSKNKNWRLLSWFAFLSRLERELLKRSVDSQEFKQLRSMIWCQI